MHEVLFQVTEEEETFLKQMLFRLRQMREPAKDLWHDSALGKLSVEIKIKSTETKGQIFTLDTTKQ